MTSLGWLEFRMEILTMLDPVIQEFLNDRIERRVEAKLKDHLKKKGEVENVDKLEIEKAAHEEYKLENWLAYCAKSAHGISLTTHPCKLSHPDANSSAIYYKSKKINQGYLQSGSTSVNDDVVFSTAAYMPIYSFLKLELNDGQELLEHLVRDTETIRKQFTGINDYDSLRNSLLQIKVHETDESTDEKIKQVFFPFSDSYHLLSIVSSSVIMFGLKERIKAINSFEGNKKAREAKENNIYHSKGYKELYDLTLQGHVKSNPQCISQLNKENFGESYLLRSIPPTIDKRLIHFPKTNFFSESFRYSDCRDVFHALHNIFKTNYNNINIREGRDYRLQEILDRIINKMWAVRAVSSEQYYADSSQLKTHQKIWLCAEFLKEREESDKWLDKLIQEISSWIIRTYEKTLGKQAVKLGEAERLTIIEVVSHNKEALR